MLEVVAVQVFRIGHCVGTHHRVTGKALLLSLTQWLQGGSCCNRARRAGAGAQAGSNGGYGGGSMSSAQADAQAQSGLDGGNANAAAQAIASSGVSHV